MKQETTGIFNSDSVSKWHRYKNTIQYQPPSNYNTFIHKANQATRPVSALTTPKTLSSSTIIRTHALILIRTHNWYRFANTWYQLQSKGNTGCTLHRCFYHRQRPRFCTKNIILQAQ